MQTKRILIIEDDADAADVLDAYLKREGYEVKIADDGLAGLAAAQVWKPDLILLDVMLPGMKGTDVLVALRRESSVPVIMVTAMGDMPDKIGALRFGADDYIVKPYNPAEVVARVQAVMRRMSSAEKSAPVLRWQELEVNAEALTAGVRTPAGGLAWLELTPTEFPCSPR